MRPFRLFFLVFTLLSLTACTVATRGAVPTVAAPTAVATSVPPTVEPTDVPVAPTDVPAQPTDSPTAVPTDVPTMPPDVPLEAFVARLEMVLVNQEWGEMAALMGNPFAVAPWRSEGRQLTPADALAEFQNGSLPAPAGVVFSGMSEADLETIFGQPPTALFVPDTPIVAALHSRGWGPSSQDEAILFIAEGNGSYSWHGFLYTNGRFADESVERLAAPAGLIYAVRGEGVFQVDEAGETQLLLDAAMADRDSLQLSPDGRYAAYYDGEMRLWLVDVAESGEPQQLAAEHTLSGYLDWGNSTTLIVGIWFNPDEGGGPNLGHIALVDATDGSVTIVDENHLSGNPPSLAADGLTLAYDVIVPDIDANTYLYNAVNGLQPFDPAAFTPNGDVIDNRRFNPAWSPDASHIAWLATTGELIGVQVFDIAGGTFGQLHAWDPARFGAILPSPVWSPDGQWLALEVWARTPAESGLWLLPLDGLKQSLVDPQGRNPLWSNDDRLFYEVHDTIRFYDPQTGLNTILELPSGRRLLLPPVN